MAITNIWKLSRQLYNRYTPSLFFHNDWEKKRNIQLMDFKNWWDGWYLIILGTITQVCHFKNSAWNVAITRKNNVPSSNSCNKHPTFNFSNVSYWHLAVQRKKVLIPWHNRQLLSWNMQSPQSENWFPCRQDFYFQASFPSGPIRFLRPFYVQLLKLLKDGLLICRRL